MICFMTFLFSPSACPLSSFADRAFSHHLLYVICELMTMSFYPLFHFPFLALYHLFYPAPGSTLSSNFACPSPHDSLLLPLCFLGHLSNCSTLTVPPYLTSFPSLSAPCCLTHPF